MRLVLSFLLSISTFSCFCQDSAGSGLDSPNKINQPSQPDTAITTQDPEVSDQPIMFISRKEFWLSISTLVVLLVILTLIIMLIKTRNLSDDLSVKLILTIVVIISTLFLVTAGYDDKSIAPAFGLFGAILGYIFGKSDKSSKND